MMNSAAVVDIATVSTELPADTNNIFSAAADSSCSALQHGGAASDPEEKQEDSGVCMDSRKTDHHSISPSNGRNIGFIKKQSLGKATQRERPLRAARLRLGRSALKEAEVLVIHSKLLEVEDDYLVQAYIESDEEEDMNLKDEEQEFTDSEDTPLVANCGQHPITIQKGEDDLVISSSQIRVVSGGSEGMREQIRIPASTLKAFPLSERAMFMILRSHQLLEEEAEGGGERVSAPPQREEIQQQQQQQQQQQKQQQPLKPHIVKTNESGSQELQQQSLNDRVVSSSSSPNNRSRHVGPYDLANASASSSSSSSPLKKNFESSSLDDEHSRFPWWQIVVCFLLLLYLWDLDQSKDQSNNEPPVIGLILKSLF